MKYLHPIAFILVVVGALNWGLFALTGDDISQWLGGMDSQTATLIYALVGLSGIYLLLNHKKDCRACAMK